MEDSPERRNKRGKQYVAYNMSPENIIKLRSERKGLMSVNPISTPKHVQQYAWCSGILVTKSNDFIDP